MRILFAIAVLVAFDAFGFKSAEWQGKRAVLEREAERLAAAYEKYEALVTSPAEDFVLPIDNWPNGAVKTGIVAKRAQFFADVGYVWGSGVKVRQFTEEGVIDSEIDAEKVVIDRTTKSCWAKGAVSARYRDEGRLSGVDCYLNLEERYLAIAKDTVVTAPSNEIRSVSAVYDNLEAVVYLEGDVKARHLSKEGETYDLSAGRAYVFFDGTNDLKRAVAMDSVKVVSDKRSGECERLTYLHDPGVVVLYGKPLVPARLEDHGKRSGTLEGSRISFWVGSEQIEVLNSVITADTDTLKVSGKAADER